MILPEVTTRVVQQLPVRGMIQRRHRGNAALEFGTVALDDLHELVLLVGGTSDQDGACSAQRFSHTLQKDLILARTAASDAVGLVMQLPVHATGPEQDALGLVRIEKVNAGLTMIEPDNSMIMVAHGVSFPA